MLRRRDRVGLRGVDHQDAAIGCCVHIDVVDADPGAADHLELGSGGDHVGVHLGRRPHHEGGGVTEARDELIAIGIDGNVYLIRGGEGIDGGIGDDFGDDNFGTAHWFLSPIMMPRSTRVIGDPLAERRATEPSAPSVDRTRILDRDRRPNVVSSCGPIHDLAKQLIVGGDDRFPPGW